jgi:hypothetical protein
MQVPHNKVTVSEDVATLLLVDLTKRYPVASFIATDLHPKQQRPYRDSLHIVATLLEGDTTRQLPCRVTAAFGPVSFTGRQVTGAGLEQQALNMITTGAYGVLLCVHCTRATASV